MGTTLSQIDQLANACVAKADQLQQIQKAEGFNGPNEAELFKQEAALREKALALNAAGVSAALAASAVAQTQLQKAITAANGKALVAKDVGKALTFAADLISLAAGALSGNAATIIGAAAQLVADATAPAPPTSGGP
jgi:hypothetical protein